jgi:ankyrin repeat protein
MFIINLLLHAVMAFSICGSAHVSPMEMPRKNELISYSVLESEQQRQLHQKLRHAIISGQLEQVRELLDTGINVNLGDQWGYTPLHCAAAYGNSNIVRELLNHGAKAEVASILYHATPLHWAAYHRQISSIILLLEHGAHLDAIETHAGTPLHIALRHHHYDTAKHLIKFGATATREEMIAAYLTPLELAAAQGDVQAVEAELISNLSPRDVEQALWFAMGRQNVPLIRLLLPRLNHHIIAQIDAVLLHNEFCLSRQAKATYETAKTSFLRQLPLVEQIIGRPVLYNRLLKEIPRLPRDLREKMYRSPNQKLLSEIPLGESEMVAFALQDANPNIRDSHYRTALELAAFHQNPTKAEEMVRLLLAHGAEPNPVIRDGHTTPTLVNVMRTTRPHIAHLIEQALIEQASQAQRPIQLLHPGQKRTFDDQSHL